jgi:signal peptidase II
MLCETSVAEIKNQANDLSMTMPNPTKRSLFQTFCLTTLPILIVVGLDFFAKAMARLYTPESVVENAGLMLGFLSRSSSQVRMVHLSTVGAFLFVIYILIQVLLPPKIRLFRIGLAIVMGGISGNWIERFWHGYVTDHIQLQLFNYASPIFNIADALQWFGYAIILYALVLSHERHHLFPENDERTGYWIDAKYQLKYCLTLVGVGLCFSLLLGVFSYAFFKYVLIELNPSLAPSFLAQNYLYPYLVDMLLVCSVFLIVLFLTGVTLSHRISGPLFAFQRYIRARIDERNSGIDLAYSKPFKLRSQDDLKLLEPLSLEIVEALNTNLEIKTTQK